MKRGKFYINVAGVKLVYGYIVTIDNIKYGLGQTNIHNSLWYLTHLQTGFAMTKGYDTIEQVLENFNANILNTTKWDVKLHSEMFRSELNNLRKRHYMYFHGVIESELINNDEQYRDITSDYIYGHKLKSVKS